MLTHSDGASWEIRHQTTSISDQSHLPQILKCYLNLNHAQRLHREAMAEGESEQSTALLDELMSYPGISEVWHSSNRIAQNTLLLTVHLQREDLELQFFSTIATLGTSYDITLQELRIECLFPADEATEQNWKQMLKAQE